MKEKEIWFDYDKTGDVMYIGFSKPTKNEIGEEIAPNIYVFTDTKTKKLIGIEIISFSKTLSKRKGLKIPLSVEFS